MQSKARGFTLRLAASIQCIIHFISDIPNCSTWDPVIQLQAMNAAIALVSVLMEVKIPWLVKSREPEKDVLLRKIVSGRFKDTPFRAGVLTSAKYLKSADGEPMKSEQYGEILSQLVEDGLLTFDKTSLKFQLVADQPAEEIAEDLQILDISNSGVQ